MGVKKGTWQWLSIFLVIISLLAVPAGHGLAEANSWDSYTQYLPGETPIVKRHLRGTWISTVVNLDWPSSETRGIEEDAIRIQKSKEELGAILDKAVEMNLNAVFLQVSPEGDAFYKSDVVPWSRYLTGTYGKDPGFDPLAFAVEEAHKRNLEIHAWFNPYRVSMNMKEATAASLDIEKSVYREHPEWIKSSAGRFVVDPGIPAARQWVMDRVMEVVNQYDVDGIHFDDYFYYENYVGELKDEDTYYTYNQGQFSNLGDWRRNNTYLLVKELSEKIRSAKPWVKFGVSPSGVWDNKSAAHPGGSNTNTSYTNYGKCFADTKKWVEEELLDYIAPQVYYSFENPRASYGEVAAWWAGVCKGKNVHLYIGQALYKINDDTDENFKGENAVPQFARQLALNMKVPEIGGSILFRVQNFNDPGKQQVVNAMKNDLWSSKALVPVMPWKGGKAPAAPVEGRLDGPTVSWTDNDPDAVYFAVYRFTKNEDFDITSDASARNLIGTVRKNKDGAQEYVDTATNNPDEGVYVITALDRLHHESSGLIISASPSKYFYDIGKEYSWAVKAIDEFYEKGIVSGVGPGRLNPGQNIKRGDFILMTVKALQLKKEYKDNFKDVPAGSYYYDAIGTAKALGIAKGSGDSFQPEEPITREDMMVVAARAVQAAGITLEKADEESLKGYKDAVLISEYARGALASLTKSGLLQGSEGGINPKGLTIRAEAMVMLHRVIYNTSTAR